MSAQPLLVGDRCDQVLLGASLPPWSAMSTRSDAESFVAAMKGAGVTSYGYRLFRVSLRRGNGRTEVPFVAIKDNNVTWRYGDHLHGLWANQVGKPVRGLPHTETPDGDEPESDANSPAFKVEECGWMGAAPTAKVRYGRQSGHDQAMAAPEVSDEKDIDISRHLPSRLHRVALVLPDGPGPGVLAVEAIGGACPVRQVVNWSRQWSKLAVQPAGDASGRTTGSWSRIPSGIRSC
jgi:hypothetical protein